MCPIAHVPHHPCPHLDLYIMAICPIAHVPIFDVGDFCTCFAIFRCFIGPLVAKLVHILVEQIISFEMSGQTSKSDKY